MLGRCVVCPSNPATQRIIFTIVGFIMYTALHLAAEQGRLARLQSVLLIELFCSKFTSNHNVTKLGSTRESSLCHRKEKEKKSPREELSKHLFSKSVGLFSFYP